MGVFSAINVIIGKTMGVGVYSVPSSIFVSVGSVGMTLLMWVLGAMISFCGLAVYLDLGTAIPKSGGERVYLERIFKQPHMLATCMFLAYVVLLGFSTPNCIVLGDYAIYALGLTPTPWNTRGIAVVVITVASCLHACCPRLGLRIINVLGVGKMVILAAVIASGFISLRQPASSTDGISTAQRNFSDIWANSSSQPYDYATALLKVLYCFRGYNTANTVMGEIRNPTRTLKIAAPIALSLVSIGYIFANIAYFCAVEKEDFRNSGVVTAGHFLRNIFGEVVGERVLPWLIIVSAFGNVAATSFAQARVNRELGREGLLPFADFWMWSGRLPMPKISQSKIGIKTTTMAVGHREDTPTAGLFLHWLVSVLVIILPPPGRIYNFLVDIGGYPVSIISVAIAGGLLHLQLSPQENWNSPIPAKKWATGIFLFANLLLVIVPWIPPVRAATDGEDSKKEDSRFPYYCYPATGIAVLALGAAYWVWWQSSRSLEGSFSGTSSIAQDAVTIELRNDLERMGLRRERELKRKQKFRIRTNGKGLNLDGLKRDEQETIELHRVLVNGTPVRAIDGVADKEVDVDSESVYSGASSSSSATLVPGRGETGTGVHPTI